MEVPRPDQLGEELSPRAGPRWRAAAWGGTRAARPAAPDKPVMPPATALLLGQSSIPEPLPTDLRIGGPRGSGTGDGAGEAGCRAPAKAAAREGKRESQTT